MDVCVCVRERERGEKREWMYVCVCEREREGERGSRFMCAYLYTLIMSNTHILMIDVHK